jgi:Transcriptional regulators
VDTAREDRSVTSGSRRSVTLSDVAEHAGVSLATASRALNGSTRVVNEELKQRVLASATALRYTTNTQAQAVARGTSRTVAIVLGDITDPYFATVASGISRAAEQRGLVVTMATTGSDVDRELATLAALRGQRPQALIMTGSRRSDPDADARVDAELAGVQAVGARVAFIGDPPEGFSGVPVAHREGAAALARALLERGYREAAVLTGPTDLVTPIERAGGFIDAMQQAGVPIPASRRIAGAFSRDGGFEAMSRLLSAGAPPALVFATTDVMAVGAMAAIRAHGLQPGRDIGVAGFDDIQMLQDVTPSLSTVSLPLIEMGERALELALAAPGESHSAPPEPIVGRVVLRDSTPGAA